MCTTYIYTNLPYCNVFIFLGTKTNYYSIQLVNKQVNKMHKHILINLNLHTYISSTEQILLKTHSDMSW